MDIEKSLSNLEKQIDAFRITGDGVAGSFKTGFTIGGTSGGGTGQTKIDEPKPEDHEGRVKALEKQFKNFTISGGAGVTVEGSMQHGFAINVQPEEGTGTGGVGGVPSGEGACCAADGTCSIMSPESCASFGGTYQGDGISCSPNPCTAPTGACCHSDETTCSIETESDCTGMGGTYQGDDTTCDPNPCCPEDVPHSATLDATLSGTYGLGELCAGAVLILEGSVSGSDSHDDVCSVLQGTNCYAPFVSASTVVDYTCPVECPPESGTYTFSVTTRLCFNSPFYGAGWYLVIDIEVITGMCGGSVVFGGDEQFVISLGSSPIGTHTFDGDDHNVASVHYSGSVTFS